MRYADEPTIEVDVEIDAPAERVWSLVADINLPSRFSSEFLGAEWLDEGPALGARFRGHNEHAAMGRWETTSWIDRFDPPHTFGWSVSDPEHPSASWWFTIEEADGSARRVRLRHGGRMGPAPSGLSIAITAMPDKEERIVARRLQEWERNMRATVEGVKALAEGQP